MTELTYGEPFLELIGAYICPEGHISNISPVLSFFFIESSESYEKGRYYVCSECNQSFHEKEWDLINK